MVKQQTTFFGAARRYLECALESGVLARAAMHPREEQGHCDHSHVRGNMGGQAIRVEQIAARCEVTRLCSFSAANRRLRHTATRNLRGRSLRQLRHSACNARRRAPSASATEMFPRYLGRRLFGGPAHRVTPSTQFYLTQTPSRNAFEITKTSAPLFSTGSPAADPSAYSIHKPRSIIEDKELARRPRYVASKSNAWGDARFPNEAVHTACAAIGCGSRPWSC